MIIEDSSDKFDTNNRFNVAKDSAGLKALLEHFLSSDSVSPKERICVVSIIGKSPAGYDGCKGAAFDEAVGRNVFRGKFNEKRTLAEPYGTDIEAFFDVRNKVLFLHMMSALDTDIIVSVANKLHMELNEKGFLQVWTDLQLDVAKTMLLLFLVSHIVVSIQPSIQFDVSYLHLFRVLDMARLKAEPYLTEVLSGIGSLSKDWVKSGRPCSPRVLFVFESFGSESVRRNRLQYELYLEDQIYRFLRKSRIITNICTNSLFAVCNQMDFVFIATKDSTIRNPNTFLIELLKQYCSTAEPPPVVEDDDRTFYNFLFSHINIALSKGFDDNVGRHNVTPVFELPTIKEFFAVFGKLRDLLYDSDTKEAKTLTTYARNCLDTDIRFSESRCSKGLPVAMSAYQDGLPTHFTREYHERKLAQALQVFALQARGPALYDYASQLKEECDRYWKNGHQMCEVLSLTGNNCINPIHKALPEEEEFVPEVDSGDVSKHLSQEMPHCSNYKLLSACNCGRRQLAREDPFTVKAANHEFYSTASYKCSCGHLERIDFPVFEPSIVDVKAAIPVPKSLFYPFDSRRSSYSPPPTHGSDQEFQSQPEHGSFTNLSQTSIPGDSHDQSKNDHSTAENATEEDKTDGDEAEESLDEEDEDEEDDYTDDDFPDMLDTFRSYLTIGKQSSTTEYLPGMLHTLSPTGLLPEFSSWSLVCLGPSSLYSHNLGLQDQPGFISGTNFLLPWDVTVKLEHTGHMPPLWEGKRPPGIKNKKNLKDGTQFTVKIFVGIEYECPRGHRFICSAPNTVLKASMGMIKDNGNRLANNDMPLYMPCVCRPNKLLMAQLQRIHIVTPKAPVHVTINPRVQPAPSPSPIFYPGNLEPIKLSQSTYWILRFPFVYEGDHGVCLPPKDQILLENCRLLKGFLGVADVVSKVRT